MNATTDMRQVIIPKSDQINADNLLAGPITITIREVKISGGTEQPVAIHYDGDNGKPYKPCKSMSRVLVAAWGPDAKAYVGRSLSLYCDPKVTWAGMAVGGIRISHMSHIDGERQMVLTSTKGVKKPFVVKPLAGAPQAPAATTQAQPPTSIGFMVGDEYREFPRNLGGMEIYIEAFDAAFQAADDKPAWFADNEKMFHELAVGAVGSRGKSARCEKLAARFDAVAAAINATLAGDTGATSDEEAAEDDDGDAVPILPLHPREGGGNDYARFHAEALPMIAGLDPALVPTWLDLHAEKIAATGKAKPAWREEIGTAAKTRMAELGEEGAT